MGLQQKRMRDVLLPSFTILNFLCIHWGMEMAMGLKLSLVEVPRTGILGHDVTLFCDYLLESDTLFSLKWYRDGHEFFKFLPGNRESPITTFEQAGVNVDLGKSSVEHGRVRLKLTNLDLNSGGTYRCEITENGKFQTLNKEGNLSVIALPSSPAPVLTDFPSQVQYAEKINGNCSFGESYPAAEITLYLNNAKINSSSGEELVKYKPVKVGERFKSTVGVKFRVASKYFKFGVLQIRCEARLFDQKWETLKNITHHNYQPPFYTAGQNRYSSGEGGSTPTCLSRILLTFFISTLWTSGF